MYLLLLPAIRFMYVHVCIIGPGCSGHHAFVHTGEEEVGGRS